MVSTTVRGVTVVWVVSAGGVVLRVVCSMTRVSLDLGRRRGQEVDVLERAVTIVWAPTQTPAVRVQTGRDGRRVGGI